MDRARSPFRFSTFDLSVLISLLLHLTAVGIFIRFTTGSPRKVHGAVSVEVIQSARHEPQSQAQIPRRTPHSLNTPKKSEALPQNAATMTVPQPPAADNPRPSGDPTGSARDSDIYVTQVTRLINRHKIYPDDAIAREQEGRVMVAITLSAGGELREVTLEEKCAFESLNRAALATIQSVGRFPRLPATIPEPLHLHIPLVFKIDR